VPAYPDAPSAFDLSFILIKRPDEVLCDDELAAIDEIVDRSIAEWVGQTRGRATLVNRTHSDAELTPGPVCDVPVGSGTEGSSDTGSAEDTDPTPTGSDDTSVTGSDSSGSGGGQHTDTSCACRHTPAGPWLLSTLLLPLLRRRRRHA
jgi:MYXO-CTERM domain-containing protein